MQPLSKLNRFITDSKNHVNIDKCKNYAIALRINTLFRGYKGNKKPRKIKIDEEFHYLRYKDDKINIKMSNLQQFNVSYRTNNNVINKLYFEYTYFNMYQYGEINNIYYKLNGNTVNYFGLLNYIRNIYIIKNTECDDYTYNNGQILQIIKNMPDCEYRKLYLYYKNDQITQIKYLHYCSFHDDKPEETFMKI